MLERLNKRTLNKLYIKEKKSLREIAKIFGCSRTTIQEKCRQYGIKLRPSSWRRIEGLNKSVLQRLYIKEGKSLVKVAEMFSCSPLTVRSRCKEYGIKTREPKRNKGVDKILRTVYFDKGQLERFDMLSAKTRVPKAVYMRDAIDLVLKKYEKELGGRLKKRERR